MSWDPTRPVTVYSVLDTCEYRRMETLSRPEAEMFAHALTKVDRPCVVVESKRLPVAWREGRREG